MQSPAPAGLFNTLLAATDSHPPMEWPSPRLWVAFVVVATAASTMSETLKKQANLPLCESDHICIETQPNAHNQKGPALFCVPDVPTARVSHPIRR